MDRLQTWCNENCAAADFEARLLEAEGSDDIGLALMAEELLPLWRRVSTGGSLTFDTS
jgi:hypothetical protein